MEYRYNIDSDGYIGGIGLGNGYLIALKGNEPFINDLSKAHKYQLVNGQWQERTWSELQIIETRYPKGLCIVELSNSEILTFECLTSWRKSDVIAAIKSIQKYSNIVIS